MAYTTIETIKKILQTLPTVFPNIYNEEIILNLFDKSYLQYNNIDTGSENVKIIRAVEPTEQTGIVLNDFNFSDLSADLIVPKTVVVAENNTIQTVYIENKDYIIDYQTGKIARATGTSISNGQSVFVAYLPFTKLTDGSDYNINLTEGSINRRAGTSIPDRATLYVDYSHAQVDVSDDLINECIDETTAIFDKLIKDSVIGSTEKAIESAATNYTMYIICLSQSQKTLRAFRADSNDIGKEWMNLSKSYLETAETFLSSYLNFGNFNAATHKINENSTFADRPTRFSFRSGRSQGSETE